MRRSSTRSPFERHDDVRISSPAHLVTIAIAIAVAIPLIAQTSSPPPVSAQIVVSATKLPETPIDLPADTTVITGAELQAMGVQTLADALATAAGVEAFAGSDQGSTLPNVSLWGLKEFDAYLVELDGVPVGGTFDPDLQQIDVRNIKRIEIVRGPAGVVHGSTAFAGVIAIYTKDDVGTHAEIAGGSFGDREARFSTGTSSGTSHWSLNGSARNYDGWRARTDGRRDQFNATWSSTSVAGGTLSLRAFGLDRRESFGAPLPVDSDTGALPPGVNYSSNLALRDTGIASKNYGVTLHFDRPLSPSLTLTDVFGYTNRRQHLARSFVDNVDGISVEGAGTDFHPEYDDLFEDLRLEWTPERHRLLAGISASYGSLSSAGRRFDLTYDLGGTIPSVNDITDFTSIRVTDRRTFAGLYVEDEWTPTARVTATGGVRYDVDDEHRTFTNSHGDASAQSRNDGASSGRAAIVYRLLTQPSGPLGAANLHVSFNRTFKPAAFDPAPQEDEGLLEPERSRSIEGGIKVAGLHDRWQVDLSAFDMDLTNLVVAANVGGNPTRVNAGEERFRGIELSGQIRPWRNLVLRGGFAAHDPKLVHFVMVTEEGDLEDDSGNMPELVARTSWNLAAIYAPDHGLGGSVTVHGVGRRALDRNNVYFTDPYTTVDASLNMPIGRTRLEIMGRNLGDSRYFTTDSELQDGLRYISAPRSVIARLSMEF